MLYYSTESDLIPTIVRISKRNKKLWAMDAPIESTLVKSLVVITIVVQLTNVSTVPGAVS